MELFRRWRKPSEPVAHAEEWSGHPKPAPHRLSDKENLPDSPFLTEAVALGRIFQR
jgi:hypothetical protein